MIARGSWLVVALALSSPAGAYAQDAVAKKDAPTHEVEAFFGNGSIVRMVLNQETIEIQTRYGKLVVPVAEIRKIDFGVHLPVGIEAKVEEAVKKLNADDYKDREMAVRDLVALGAHAYPAVHHASKSSEPETAKRAEVAKRAIQAKVPAGQLRLTEDDVIITNTFTIVGRVTTPAIKASAEYFGELQLPLAALRQLRWLVNSGNADLVVDAAKHGSVADQWMDTGYVADGNSKLTITATGQVDLWPQGPGQYMTTPKGYGNPGGFNPNAKGALQRALPGSLVGKIGESGEPFVIGERLEIRPTREGRLYLHILPSPWNNASTGQYQVRVISTRE